MNLVSVIVPIYKVEEYLEKCLDSICSQTYRNLEIILVDDGSPDNSGAICDSWAEKDNRIIVIHQTNHGGGHARNLALDQANGEFIAFVDSDDYIAPQMIEYLVGFLNKYGNVDIVECDYASFSDGNYKFNEVDKTEGVKIYSSLEAMRENILDHYFRQLIWNKLYRRKVIGDIRFPVGTKIDDEFWTYQVLGNANGLLRVNNILYAYRQQPNSVMHSMGVSKRIQGIEAKCKRHEYVRVNFPQLEFESCCSLYNACVYQGQLSMKFLKAKERKNILLYLKSIIKKYPVSCIKHKNLSTKKKVWIKMTQLSLPITCKIRNILGVGF